MSCHNRLRIKNLELGIKVLRKNALYSLFFILYSLFLTTPVFADWTFNVDLPNCGNTSSTYYYTPGPPYPTITASSNDTDLSFIALDISPTSAQSSCTPALPQTDTTAPFSITCNWNTTGLSGDHTFSITALNTSGNTKLCTALYIQGFGPWLKTTSGDVHSNTRITAPNGP